MLTVREQPAAAVNVDSEFERHIGHPSCIMPRIDGLMVQYSHAAWPAMVMLACLIYACLQTPAVARRMNIHGSDTGTRVYLSGIDIHLP